MSLSGGLDQGPPGPSRCLVLLKSSTEPPHRFVETGQTSALFAGSVLQIGNTPAMVFHTNSCEQTSKGRSAFWFFFNGRNYSFDRLLTEGPL